MSLRRRIPSLSSALALLLSLPLVLALLALRSEAGPARPNFLVLLADDQRADTVQAWGNPHIRTPNLNRLVRRGFSFKGNYCFGANNGAVCIPSRAMIMSGRTWFDVKSNLEQVPLLPALLADGGYTTFATGKWHNEKPAFARAFQRGQSIFFGGMDDHTKVPVVDYENGTFSPKRTASRFSSEEFADAAIRFLDSQTQSASPFFCYVAFTAPHDPRNPPAPDREPYYRRKPPLPANFLPVHPFDNGFTVNLRDENLAAYPRTPAVIREQLAEYFGLVTHLDTQVGRILDALARSPHATNTYVIYAADSGLAMGSHGLLGKQSVYEHSMRAPLIIAGPGIPAQRATHAFTYLFDLFPTITDLAGISPPATLAGSSLRPLWTGEKQQIRTSVFLPFTTTMRAVRDDRWKLILYPAINHRQLFDLQADPHETRNLADTPAAAAQIPRLTKLLAEWQRNTGDTQPLTTPNPKPKEVHLDGYTRKPDPWQPDWIVKKYF